MSNSFDFKNFEQRLLEALNKNEKFIKILEAQDSAADQAKKMGLTSMGFGRWGKDDKVTHQTKDGKLEPVKDDEQDKEKDAQQGAAKDKKYDKKNAASKQGDAKDKKDSKADVTKQHKDPERQKAQQVLPNARLTGRPLSRVPREDLAPVVTRIEDLARMGREAKARGEDAPNFNLCDASIPGTNLFCGGNKGIPRAEMPQFKGQPEPGSPADKLPRDRNGEVDTEEMFKQMLERDGIGVSEPKSIPPDQLRSTQSELVGVKVAGMSEVLEAGQEHPAYRAITAPIYVSRDGYVLDGHHRWAAIVAHNAANPDNQIEMQVRVIDEDIEPLVARSNQFAQDIGIRPKAASTGAAGEGKPKEEPKPAEKEPEEKAEPKKPTWRRALDAVQGWGKKQKEEARKFFKGESHVGGSPERRTMVQSIRDKAVGAVKAVAHGLAHTATSIPKAARGVGSLLRGKKPSDEDRHAMIHVGVTLAMTAIFGVAGGHAAHGISSFAAHVLQEFIPHAVIETVGIGAGRAALFAGDEDTSDNKMMEKYLEMILKNIEELDIPDEILAKAIETYDPNKKIEFNMKDFDSEEAYNKLKEK